MRGFGVWGLEVRGSGFEVQGSGFWKSNEKKQYTKAENDLFGSDEFRG